MKKRFTKIGALVLSAVMLGGTILGGCGASDKKESGSETVSKETQTAAAEADSDFKKPSPIQLKKGLLQNALHFATAPFD